MSRHPAAVIIATLMVAVLAACGAGSDLLPGLTDASTCADAQAVVDEAVTQTRVYIGSDASDLARADQLIFALSAVDERAECFEEQTIEQARGLRLSLSATGG